MNTKLILMSSLLLISLNAKSQKADSLLRKAIDTLDNLEISEKYFRHAVGEVSDDRLLEIYHKYCIELLYSSELELLQKLSAEALKFPFDDKTYKQYINILRHRFDVFNLRKEYDSTIAALDDFEALAVSFRDTSNIIRAYIERGGFLESAGDLPKALDWHFKALELSEKSKDTLGIAKAYINLGIFYQKIDKPRLSLSYNKKALDTYIKLGETIKMAQIYNNVGLAYDDLGFINKDPLMFDSAGYYFDRGYAIAEKVGNEFGKAVTRLNQGLNAYRKEEFQKAIGIFDEVFVYFNKVSDDFGLSLCYLNWCRIYHKLGDIDRAIEMGMKGYQIAKANNYVNELQQTSKSLFQLYELKNNPAKAYGFYKDFTAARDTLFNQKKEREIGRLESKFELNKSLFENQLLEKEIDLKSQTITAQRATITGAIIAVVSLIAITFLFRKQLIQRKKLNKKIESQAEKLRELDKAKTRFFANISHDLRSPLTLILGALDKINERDYAVLDSESRALLDVGYKNGKRLLYLADEIMDLTRLEEGKISLDLQYVKIVPYLRLLTKMFSSAADIKMIELQFKAEADEETILHLDPHQFEKIIYNLLSNAIKFTPNNGKVNIHLRTLKNEVNITIKDSGIGIPIESIPHVFDRFYQSGANEFTSQAGVGIGLALVKELIELHDGKIEVSSSNAGTAFLISIPFKESDWVSQAIVPERSLDVVTRNSLWVDLQEEKEKHQIASLTNPSEDAKSVLIVEDHKELRSFLKSMLTEHFKVYLAANGASALDILQSEKIDLVVTDLMMPYMDGFELIDHLKKDKELRKLPVLVVSARTDKEEKLELLAKGANEVINKPFDKDELLIRVQNILTKEWDNEKKLGNLYTEKADEFEKSVMARLERLIIKRIDDPHLTVLDLADEMAASERKVYRMIKKISGLTPYELIKEVRWQYLEEYLKKNKIRTATEAAQLIGMNNVSSFSEQYNKRFGHSIKEMVD